MWVRGPERRFVPYDVSPPIPKVLSLSQHQVGYWRQTGGSDRSHFSVLRPRIHETCKRAHEVAPCIVVVIVDAAWTVVGASGMLGWVESRWLRLEPLRRKGCSWYCPELCFPDMALVLLRMFQDLNSSDNCVVVAASPAERKTHLQDMMGRSAR